MVFDLFRQIAPIVHRDTERRVISVLILAWSMLAVSGVLAMGLAMLAFVVANERALAPGMLTWALLCIGGAMLSVGAAVVAGLHLYEASLAVPVQLAGVGPTR